MMEDNSYVLEQMKSEYQTLKETLAHQEIINDKLMRETMRLKVRSMRSTITISIFCGIFVIMAAPFVFHYNPVINASWWFVAGTVLLMVFCIFLDWKYNHKVQNANLSTCDLLTFSKNVQEMKMHYRDWTKWGIMLGLAWVIWLGIEAWSHSTNLKLTTSLIAGVSIGFIAGAILGLRMNSRIIRTCDEIISQIED